MPLPLFYHFPTTAVFLFLCATLLLAGTASVNVWFLHSWGKMICTLWKMWTGLRLTERESLACYLWGDEVLPLRAGLKTSCLLSRQKSWEAHRRENTQNHKCFSHRQTSRTNLTDTRVSLNAPTLKCLTSVRSRKVLQHLCVVLAKYHVTQRSENNHGRCIGGLLLSMEVMVRQKIFETEMINSQNIQEFSQKQS